MHATETVVHCNEALDAVARQIFPNNAHAKQKKYLRQGMWKPKALTIRQTCTRINELNNQLSSYPNQTGALPEDELKSAFINICLPEWQQEFLKTGINEYSSTWDEILTKAEAMENAETASAEQTPAHEKRDLEEGELPSTSKQPPKKKAKKGDKDHVFFCKLHGGGQNHDTVGCKVINAEIERLKQEKQGRKPSSSFSKNNNNQQSATKSWTDRKRPATSYSTEQLKDIVRMTKKKVMQKAKANYELQLQEDIQAMNVDEDVAQDRAKMHEMESFMQNLVDEDEYDTEGDQNLTQDEIDELTACTLSDWPTGLDTEDKQYAWYEAQEINVWLVDYNPLNHEYPNNDEYIVHIFNKTTNTIIPYPHAQAKELFPAILAWHAIATVGRKYIIDPQFGNPRLAWTVDFWDRMTAPFVPSLNKTCRVRIRIRSVHGYESQTNIRPNPTKPIPR